jgi:6-phosphogluconolactonase
VKDSGSFQVVADAEAFARAGAEEVRDLARAAVAEGRSFSLALTGGGSPVGIYRLLGTDEFAASIPWDRVHLFWGDDRCVPPGHPRSNFGMANELFVGSVPIPSANVHRISGESGAEEAARRYAAEIQEFFGDQPPVFDLVHLGVGGDGHVASLFPFQLENLAERTRMAIPAVERSLGEPRVSLSFGVINAARVVRMLLPEAGQADLVRRITRGPLDPFRLPVQLVNPVDGVQRWLLTEASARAL